LNIKNGERKLKILWFPWHDSIFRFCFRATIIFAILVCYALSVGPRNSSTLKYRQHEGAPHKFANGNFSFVTSNFEDHRSGKFVYMTKRTSLLGPDRPLVVTPVTSESPVILRQVKLPTFNEDLMYPWVTLNVSQNEMNLYSADVETGSSPIFAVIFWMGCG
jgi:hypothetical protein